MRHRLVLIALLIISIHAYGQHKSEFSINYGVKTGFSSTIYDVNEFTVLQTPITEYTSHSEISSFYTGFVRFNLNRHYLQTECSYNISKYSISFPVSEWYPISESKDNSAIYTKITGIEFPLYYGYHIIKDREYGMSFFMGPKAKFVITDISNHVFEKLPFSNVAEVIYPINFSLMVGLGISISPVFFDFSFEYGLHNISDYFEATLFNGDISHNALVFDRRKNVLSFSIGFMF